MTEPDRSYPDRSYMDELTIALRARDVPGARIGEVLAEVRAHTAESGESARRAFGPPQAYADAVVAAMQAHPRERPLLVGGLTPRLVARAAATLVGVLLLTGGGLDMLSPEAAFGIGWAALGLVLAGPLLVVVWINQVGRASGHARRRWLTSGALAWLVALTAVALDKPLWHIPWAVAIPVGIMLLVLGLRGLRPDPVADPTAGSQPRRAR